MLFELLHSKGDRMKDLYNLVTAHLPTLSLTILQDNSVMLDFLNGVLKNVSQRLSHLSICH